MKKYRKLLLSALALLVSLSMLAGVTYAWFVVEGEVRGFDQPAVAGYLDVEVKGYEYTPGTNNPIEGSTYDFMDDSSPPLIDDELIAPGMSGVKYIRVENVGPLNVKFAVNLIFQLGYGASEGEPLAETLSYQVSYHDSLSDAMLHDPASGVWYRLVDPVVSTYKDLDIGSVAVCRVDYEMHGFSGNSYQVKAFSAHFQLYATQKIATDDPDP